MHTGRQWLMAGAAAVLAFAGLATAAVRYHTGADRRWDARILPIARFVERDRGRRFRSPVTVDLVPPDRFRAVIGADRPLSPARGAALARSLVGLRAVGLVSGQVDLAAVSAQPTPDDVVGVYRRATKHIYIRGAELTPAVRVTIAHELTHALQDQEVDLGALEGRQGSAGLSARAVVEGDAVAVENAYAATLSPADAASYRTQRAADATASPADPSVPAVLADEAAFPYIFGPTFVGALRQRGGTQAVDRALRHPPQADADIIDPDRWLRGVAPRPVTPPRLAAAETAVGRPEPFGQLTLFELLASRLSYRQAWEAARAWQGDVAVSYRSAESTCVAVSTIVADVGGASRLGAAATQWATTQPGATVAVHGTTVELRSCDRGRLTTLPAPVDPPPFRVLSLRASLIGLFITRRTTASAAACAADQVIDLVGSTDLFAYDEGSASAAVAARITDAGGQAVAACSPPPTTSRPATSRPATSARSAASTSPAPPDGTPG